MSQRAFVALLVLASAAGAQDRAKCYFDNTANTRQRDIKTLGGNYNSYIGGGIVVRCPSRDLRLRADSLESYGDEGRIFLLGHVKYDEPRLSLTSDYLTYRQLTEHIFASGNVVTTSPKSGSTLRGPSVEYWRAMPDRPATKLVAVGRPTVTLLQKDTTGNPSDTLVVVSDRLTMIGDSLVFAGGKVVMTRPEVEATGDSVDIDSERELMVLMKQPLITGRKERPFTLAGTRIEMTTRNRKLDRVFAMGQGKATSQDIVLTSDTIDLRIRDDLLQRAMAWGPKRASATSPSQKITADSIDVLMPNQRLFELRAVRGAAAEGQPDTTRFKVDTTDAADKLDRLNGDTIVARFDTTAARDSTKGAALKELLARGAAKSYYHLAPADTTLRKAAVNYVAGGRIVVAFNQQRRASKVTVNEKAWGIYIEPKPEPKTPAKASSTTAAPTPPQRPPVPRPDR